jgi:hypothetical protein
VLVPLHLRDRLEPIGRWENNHGWTIYARV